MKDIFPDSFYDRLNIDSKQQIEDTVNYLDILFELSPESKNMTVEQLYKELKDGLKNWTDIKRNTYFE